jgi:hypothetical protein
LFDGNEQESLETKKQKLACRSIVSGLKIVPPAQAPLAQLISSQPTDLAQTKLVNH